MKAYDLLNKFTTKLIEVFAYHGQKFEIIGIPTEEEVIKATEKYNKCPDKDCVDFDPFDERDWGYEFNAPDVSLLMENGIVIKRLTFHINDVECGFLFLCQGDNGAISGVFIEDWGYEELQLSSDVETGHPHWTSMDDDNISYFVIKTFMAIYKMYAGDNFINLRKMLEKEYNTEDIHQIADGLFRSSLTGDRIWNTFFKTLVFTKEGYTTKPISYNWFWDLYNAGRINDDLVKSYPLNIIHQQEDTTTFCEDVFDLLPENFQDFIKDMVVKTNNFDRGFDIIWDEFTLGILSVKNSRKTNVKRVKDVYFFKKFFGTEELAEVGFVKSRPDNDEYIVVVRPTGDQSLYRKWNSYEKSLSLFKDIATQQIITTEFLDKNGFVFEM